VKIGAKIMPGVPSIRSWKWCYMLSQNLFSILFSLLSLGYGCPVLLLEGHCPAKFSSIPN